MRTGTVKLLSGTIVLPLKICSRASNLPGPQLRNGVLSTTAGDSATIAPTFSVRFGQPSSRRPIPVVIALSTVEWHSAHVMPTDARRLSTTFPTTPMTALSLSSSSVTAGSSRFTCPALIALITSDGSASESTFRPTDRAVRGLTVSMTLCICSVSVHSCSSPNVSKRKIVRPSPDVMLVFEEGGSANASTDPNRPAIPIPAITTVARLIVISSWIKVRLRIGHNASRRRPHARPTRKLRSAMNLMGRCARQRGSRHRAYRCAVDEKVPGGARDGGGRGSTIRDPADNDVSRRVSCPMSLRSIRTGSPFVGQHDLLVQLRNLVEHLLFHPERRGEHVARHAAERDRDADVVVDLGGAVVEHHEEVQLVVADVLEIVKVA